jgi:hypothetical protein
MKKNLPSLLALACIVVASQLISCTDSYEPIRFDEPGPFTYHGTYDSSRYRLDEIIVMFKHTPTDDEINKLKGKIHGQHIDSATIERRQCNCNKDIELWQATNLHSRIHADGLAAGSRPPGGSQGVGEDGLAYYSLNFIQNIPVDSLENHANFNYDSIKKVENNKAGKEIVRIAVLDTGMDTDKIISPSYRWTNQPEGDNVNDTCYTTDTFGWNFIKNNNNVTDDNEGRHGTLVSHYIINEFATSENKAVELMTLKTHDKDGSGDLFWSICAIHYAMKNKAKIINASWGFYYYQEGPHPYLDSLIKQVLRRDGILFVAAAGNKIDQVDDDASKAYLIEHGVPFPPSHLRNLEYHNFYPACLSRDDNNVITVTTADETKVSPTQNYSSKYVDFGAIPDDLTLMRFKLPFGSTVAVGTVPTISGSSFAAPIVAGRIGASLPNSSYVPNIDKRDVFSQLEAAALTMRSSLLQSEHIRKGRITPHK